jgi:hypothetical protein
MKNLFYFIAGVFFVTLISATTVSIMTVKPQTPKLFIVKNFNFENNSESVSEFIQEKLKQGWILKQVSGSNDSEDHSCWIVVLEKY